MRSLSGFRAGSTRSLTIREICADDHNLVRRPQVRSHTRCAAPRTSVTKTTESRTPVPAQSAAAVPARAEHTSSGRRTSSRCQAQHRRRLHEERSPALPRQHRGERRSRARSARRTRARVTCHRSTCSSWRRTRISISFARSDRTRSTSSSSRHLGQAASAQSDHDAGRAAAAALSDRDAARPARPPAGARAATRAGQSLV
jgi:hypothetical protein